MKRGVYILFFAILSALCLQLNAQEEMDTLMAQLKAAQEPEKASLHNKIAKAYWKEKDQTKLIMEHSQQALTLSRKFNLKDQESLALSNLSMALHRDHKEKAAMKNARKALKIAEIIKNIPAQLEALKLMDKLYLPSRNYLKILDIFKKQLDLYTSTNDKENIAYLTHVTGSLYLRLGDKNTWHEYIKNAMKLYEENGNESRMIQMMTYQAKDFLDFGQLDQAEQLINRALELSLKIKDLSMYCRSCLNVIGKAWLTEDIDRMNQGQAQMLTAANKIENRLLRDIWAALSWEQLARGQNKLKQFKEAIHSVEKGLAVEFEDPKEKRSRSNGLYFQLGEAHLGLGEFNKALTNFQESINVINETGDIDTLALVSLIKGHNKVAFSHLQLNNPKQARKSLKTSENLIKQLKVKSLKVDTKLLAEFHQYKAMVLKCQVNTNKASSMNSWLKTTCKL